HTSRSGAAYAPAPGDSLDERRVGRDVDVQRAARRPHGFTRRMQGEEPLRGGRIDQLLRDPASGWIASRGGKRGAEACRSGVASNHDALSTVVVRALED